MTLKIGDKVRIKEDLSKCKFGHNSYMDAYIGKEATVIQTFKSVITLDVDNRAWNWSEEVLEKIEEDKTHLKGVDVEPTDDISVEATDEQIDSKEALQKALDEVREQLLKTKGKLIHMKEESVENDHVNSFMEEYKKIVTDTMELCIAKNKDYGSSVQDTYERFGDISYLVRITDKYNRICTLLDKEAEVKDENIDDTIKDMGNYLFLWLASRRLNNKGENNE